MNNFYRIAMFVSAIATIAGCSSATAPNKQSDWMANCATMRIIRGPFPPRTPPDSIRVLYPMVPEELRKYPELDWASIDQYDTIAVMTTDRCYWNGTWPLIIRATVDSASSIGGDAAFWAVSGMYSSLDSPSDPAKLIVEAHILRRKR